MPGTEGVSVAFTEAAASGDWEGAQRILLDAIAGCTKAREIQALFGSRGIDEVVLGDGCPLVEVADALVARAVAMPPKDGAKTLGWLVALATATPTTVLAPRSARTAFEAALDRHVELFRAWAGDRSRERRLAGMHLLAWCEAAGEVDARALLDAVPAEKTADTAATALLSAAVLAARLDRHSDAVRALARPRVTHADPLVRVCAAVALVLVGETLDAAATRALVEPWIEALALPAPWGWRGLDATALAAAVLARLQTAAPDTAIDALESVRPDLSTPLRIVQTSGVRHAIAGTIFRLAFDARGAPVPRTGIAASELDPTQRRAVEAAERLRAPVPQLCLRDVEDDVGLFLSGGSLHFRPIAIEHEGRVVRWHFARILGAIAYEEIPVTTALAAVVALAPEDAADLASRWSSGRVWLDQHVTDEAARGRILSFCLAVLERLRGRGLDLAALGRAALEDRSRSSPDHAVLALAVIRASGGEVEEALIPLVARAAETGWWREALRAEVAALPAPIRARALAAMRPTELTLPLLAMGLDAATVQRIALTRWWDRPEAAIAVLATGGPEVEAALRAMVYPNDTVRAWAAPFVESALAAWREGTRRRPPEP